MLRLMFRDPASSEPVELEARDGFKIIGTLVLRCPESEMVARYSNGRWQIDDRDTARLDCAQTAWLRFGNSDDSTSPTFGPFGSLSIEKGCCYADRILFAELITLTERWRHCETGLRWRSLFICPRPG